MNAQITVLFSASFLQNGMCDMKWYKNVVFAAKRMSTTDGIVYCSITSTGRNIISGSTYNNVIEQSHAETDMTFL